MARRMLLLIAVLTAAAAAPASAGMSASPSRSTAPIHISDPILQGGPYEIFKTDQNPFTADTENQGWWSTTEPSGDTNDNYFAGGLTVGDDHRNFFSFDLAQLSGTVIRAELLVARYYALGGDTETLSLYDVSTDAATLNFNEGNNEAIFDDLGSGVEYGSYELRVRGKGVTILRFELNAAGVAGVNAAIGGWFSIGGRVVTAEGPSEYLFGYSGPIGPQWLVVQLAE